MRSSVGSNSANAAELERARTTGDYSSLRLWDVSWDEFASPAFVKRVAHINNFVFTAQLSGLGMWDQIVRSNRLALELHRELEEALEQAQFVNIPAIETRIEKERVMFRYGDGEYGFTLIFSGDGRILLQRDGSSLKTFHHWYTNFMPSVPVLLTKAIAVIDGEVANSLGVTDGHPTSKTPRSRDVREFIRILSAGFSFRLICHNFNNDNGGALNVDVMRKNVAVRVPDLKGRLSEEVDHEQLHRYGRMDYKVSLRHDSESAISQFLTVEAPSNSGWAGLFIDLSYVGENYYTVRDDPGSPEYRKALDPELFLSSAQCADAYISFFRDMGLLGFVQSVTEGFEFDTTPVALG